MSAFEVASAVAGWVGMITSLALVAMKIRDQRRLRESLAFRKWVLKTNRELAGSADCSSWMGH